MLLRIALIKDLHDFRLAHLKQKDAVCVAVKNLHGFLGVLLLQLLIVTIQLLLDSQHFLIFPLGLHTAIVLSQQTHSGYNVHAQLTLTDTLSRQFW